MRAAWMTEVPPSPRRSSLVPENRPSTASGRAVERPRASGEWPLARGTSPARQLAVRAACPRESRLVLPGEFPRRGQ